MRRDNIAINTAALFGHPFDIPDAALYFRFGLREGLALLRRQNTAQVVEIFCLQIRPAAQDFCALSRQHATPCAKGFVSRRNRAARFIGAHIGHGAENFARCGVGNLNRLAAVGGHPLAVDIGHIAPERGVFQLQRGGDGFGFTHGV